MTIGVFVALNHADSVGRSLWLWLFAWWFNFFYDKCLGSLHTKQGDVGLFVTRLINSITSILRQWSSRNRKLCTPLMRPQEEVLQICTVGDINWSFCEQIAIYKRSWTRCTPLPNSLCRNVHVCSQWCMRRRCRGCKRTPKSFDLSKIRAEALNIWAKSLKIWAKFLKIHSYSIRAKMATSVCRKTNKDLFWEVLPKKVFLKFVRENF